MTFPPGLEIHTQTLTASSRRDRDQDDHKLASSAIETRDLNPVDAHSGPPLETKTRIVSLTPGFETQTTTRAQAGDAVPAADARQVALHLQPARLQPRRGRHLSHSQGPRRPARRHDKVTIPSASTPLEHWGSQVERRRRENRGAVGGQGGEVWGEAVPLPRKFMSFSSQNGVIWCILGVLFLRSMRPIELKNSTLDALQMKMTATCGIQKFR